GRRPEARERRGGEPHDGLSREVSSGSPERRRARGLVLPFDVRSDDDTAVAACRPWSAGAAGAPSLEEMAHLLGAEALHLEYPTKVVFDGVSLGVDEGDRIGIVGRNGDGKSSLLAMLAGRREPDAGRVTFRGGIRVGVLDQADTLDDSLTIAQSVVGDVPEYEWAGDARVRDVIEGLLGDLDWDAPVLSLSGGQRRRV